MGGTDGSSGAVSVTRAAPLFPELAAVFEADRKLVAGARMRAALAGALHADAEVDGGDDGGMAYADGGDDDYDDYGGGFGEDAAGGGFGDDFGSGGGVDGDGVLGAADLDMAGDGFGIEEGDGGDAVLAGSGAGGYEELVRRHVASFQKGA